MLAAAIVLLVLLVGSAFAVLQLRNALNEISAGSLAAVNMAADARIDANNAKSNESLTLIARGTGQSFEEAWKSSAGSVTDNVQRLTDRPELVSQWQDYTWGSFSDCSSAAADMDHGVQVVGFNTFNTNSTHLPNVDVWLVRNSWGEDWGENGYIEFDGSVNQINTCGISNEAIYITPKF